MLFYLLTYKFFLIGREFVKILNFCLANFEPSFNFGITIFVELTREVPQWRTKVHLGYDTLGINIHFVRDSAYARAVGCSVSAALNARVFLLRVSQKFECRANICLIP